jgi:hypothetical protein
MVFQDMPKENNELILKAMADKAKLLTVFS